jgi:hypothetical protein
VDADQHPARCGSPAPERPAAALSAETVLVRHVLVNEHMDRRHQAWNLLPHDRQRRLGITFVGDPRHQVEMIIETLSQLCEQNPVAHRPALLV